MSYEIIHLPKEDQKFLWVVLDTYNIRHFAFWHPTATTIDIVASLSDRPSIEIEYEHVFAIVFPAAEWASEPYYVYFIKDADHSFMQRYNRLKNLKAFI
jgi:hypothetical protein